MKTLISPSEKVSDSPHRIPALKTLDKLGTLLQFGIIIYKIKKQPTEASRFSVMNVTTIFFSLIVFEKYMNLQVLVQVLVRFSKVPYWIVLHVWLDQFSFE